MSKTFYATVRQSFGPLRQSQVEGFNTILDATQHLPVQFRAYLLATVWLETARTMQPITEYGSTSYFDKYNAGTRIGKVLGNTRPGDGFRFRGHGYVMLTGRDNFVRASGKLGIDLVSNPSLALRPDIAAKILVMGCTEGWFTGKKLSDYLPGDYANARRVVNGLDRATTIATYARIFEGGLRTLPKPKLPRPAPTQSFWQAIAEFFRKLFGVKS